MIKNRVSGSPRRRLALIKGAEHYIVLYTTETRSDAVRQLGQWAANKELSFSWYDAAFLSQAIQQQAAT